MCSKGSRLQKSLEAPQAGEGGECYIRALLVCRKSKAAFRFKKQGFHPAQKGRNRNGLFLAPHHRPAPGCSASWWVSMDSADLEGGMGGEDRHLLGLPDWELSSVTPILTNPRMPRTQRCQCVCFLRLSLISGYNVHAHPLPAYICCGTCSG